MADDGGGARRGQAVRRAALFVSRRRLLGDRIRNRATYEAMRRSTSLDEVREVFSTGLNEAVRAPVRLEVDHRVDPYALRSLAMNAIVLLRAYRVTDLREVRIDTSNREMHQRGAPAAVTPNRVLSQQGKAVSGSSLWFNPDQLTTATFPGQDWLLRDSARRGVHPHAYRMGLTATMVAHEIGHLVGNAARAKVQNTPLGNALARTVVNSVDAEVQARVWSAVRARYAQEQTYWKTAPASDVVERHNRELRQLNMCNRWNSPSPNRSARSALPGCRTSSTARSRATSSVPRS